MLCTFKGVPIFSLLLSCLTDPHKSSEPSHTQNHQGISPRPFQKDHSELFHPRHHPHYSFRATLPIRAFHITHPEPSMVISRSPGWDLNQQPLVPEVRHIQSATGTPTSKLVYRPFLLLINANLTQRHADSKEGPHLIQGEVECEPIISTLRSKCFTIKPLRLMQKRTS